MKKAIIFIFLLSLTFFIGYNNSAQKHHKITTPSPTAIQATPRAATPFPVKENSIIYIGNKNSKKFHREDCYSLPKEENRIIFSNREKAINSGFSPCQHCQP